MRVAFVLRSVEVLPLFL